MFAFVSLFHRIRLRILLSSTVSLDSLSPSCPVWALSTGSPTSVLMRPYINAKKGKKGFCFQNEHSKPRLHSEAVASADARAGRAAKNSLLRSQHSAPTLVFRFYGILHIIKSMFWQITFPYHDFRRELRVCCGNLIKPCLHRSSPESVKDDMSLIYCPITASLSTSDLNMSATCLFEHPFSAKHSGASAEHF